MTPFDNIAELVFSKLHEKSNFDLESQEFITDMINGSIAFVVKQLSNRYTTEEELKEKVGLIADSVIGFIAVTVVQLEFFGRGENDGPFFDLLRKHFEDENSNDSGLTPTQ